MDGRGMGHGRPPERKIVHLCLQSTRPYLGKGDSQWFKKRCVL